MVQGTLDGHLRELPPTEWVIQYSDKAFREAAVDWLIMTDQVCISGPNACNLISNFLFSHYKHSSTPHSIRWSTSQHMQPTVSPSQTKRQLVTKLWICLILRWYTSKLASVYVSVWYQLHPLTLWYRAMLSRVISVWHVMHTLQWWDTGLKSHALAYGRSRVLSLVSWESTVHIMGNGLAALYSRLLTDWVLLIEYVNFYFIYFSWISTNFVT